MGIEAEATFRLIRSVHPVAIELARHDVSKIAMPDVFATLGQCYAFEFTSALIVEQTKLDPLRIGGE